MKSTRCSLAIWWILSEGMWWKVFIRARWVRVAIAISVLNGGFDRPYAWRVPVVGDESE